MHIKLKAVAVLAFTLSINFSLNAQVATPVAVTTVANRDSIFPQIDPNTVYGKQGNLAAGGTLNIQVGIGFNLTAYANGVITNAAITIFSSDSFATAVGTLGVGHFGDWNETTTTYNILMASAFVSDGTVTRTSGRRADGFYFLTLSGTRLDALENQWATGNNPGLFF